jgi:hypothetical protein
MVGARLPLTVIVFAAAGICLSMQASIPAMWTGISKNLKTVSFATLEDLTPLEIRLGFRRAFGPSVFGWRSSASIPACVV